MPGSQNKSSLATYTWAGEIHGVVVQVLCEVVFKFGFTMATHHWLLSNVSKPLKARMRTQFAGGKSAVINCTDTMIYAKPTSSTRELLVVNDRGRWAHLINTSKVEGTPGELLSCLFTMSQLMIQPKRNGWLTNLVPKLSSRRMVAM